MNASDDIEAGGYCKSCGVPFSPGARFCRGCGAARPQIPSDAPPTADAASDARTAVHPHADEQAQQDAAPVSAAGQPQPGAAYHAPAQARSPTPPAPSARPDEGGAASPAPQPPAHDGYPVIPPGYQPSAPGYPGYAGQPPGYQAPPHPGYATPAAGYPVQQGQAPLPQHHEQRSTTSRWLIGGIAAAVVAIVGVGVAVVLSTGGSSTPTQLVAAPVVTGGSSTVTTPASTAAKTSPPSHPSTPTPSTPTVTTPAVVTTPRVTISQQVGQRQAVENTIHQEFALISEHKFSAAYALLAPSLQTGEEGWVDSHREEGIYNVSVATNATIHSPESATASIISMRTLDGGGCKDWTGSWNLLKVDGQWRIDEANLTPESC
jgi:hypothetical protein